MTSLPNASSLFIHLEAELVLASRDSRSVAVMVCDLDGFKQVNDRFGHLIGNRVLQTIGRQLKEDCHGGEYVARMGGDEFVIALPGAAEERLRLKERRLAEIVSQAGLNICGEDVLAVSIGSAYYPDDGSDTESLLAVADRRMYAEKASHRLAGRATTPALSLQRLERSVAGTPVPVSGPS